MEKNSGYVLPSTNNQDLEAQREYVKEIEAKGFTYELTVADAFIRGMRDIGYKHLGTVLNELIDNSLQAGAENVLVEFGYQGISNEKPTEIAVIDDGHGMPSGMLRLSVIWGGTHRADNRKGFGRFGYGLPSAAINQGRRYTVYSKAEGSDLYKVTIDLDEIQEGKYTRDGRIVVPEPEPAELPMWLEYPIQERLGEKGLSHGTVVVIEKLDRVTWKTRAALERNLLPHFGSTYRNYLREFSLWVNDKAVRPVDPLFLTSGYQFYDVDDDRAEGLPPLTIDVKNKDTKKPLGTVKVRFSYMPPTFARATEDKKNPAGKKNPRFSVLKENIGIHVLRQGRQIDIVIKNPWTIFRNDDRYWGVEVDFPATLDEEFQITTNKQQVVLTDRMWEILEQNGVYKAIREMRARYNREKKQLDVDREEDGQQLLSEQAMQQAEKFRTTGKPVDSPERQSQGLQAFNSEVQRRSNLSGVAPEQIERELLAEIQDQLYKKEEEYLPGAPFYRAEQRGGQMVLKLNTAHRFYQDVYKGPDSTPSARAALEVLLFVIGDCELDASDDRSSFYQQERALWSNKLEVSLDQLRQAHATAEVAQDLSDDAEERADRETTASQEDLWSTSA